MCPSLTGAAGAVGSVGSWAERACVRDVGAPSVVLCGAVVLENLRRYSEAMTTNTTDDQERALAKLNDTWGVASFTLNEDGALEVELDDGQRIIVARDGEEEWL